MKTKFILQLSFITVISFSSCTYKQLVKNLYEEDGKYQFTSTHNNTVERYYTFSELQELGLTRKIEAIERMQQTSKNKEEIKRINLKIKKNKKYLNRLEKEKNKLSFQYDPPLCDPTGVWYKPRPCLEPIIKPCGFILVNDRFESHRLKSAKITGHGHVFIGKNLGNQIVFKDFHSGNPSLASGKYTIEINLVSTKPGNENINAILEQEFL